MRRENASRRERTVYSVNSLELRVLYKDWKVSLSQYAFELLLTFSKKFRIESFLLSFPVSEAVHET